MKMFDGRTYEPPHDESRLQAQLSTVREVMIDGKWRTFAEINRDAQTNYPHPSISARLRDFRKPKFGGHTVDRQRRGEPRDGLFEYRLLVAKEKS